MMKRYFPAIILILFLILILGFSAQSGNTTNSLSSGIAKKVETLLHSKGDYSYNFATIHYTIRKLAHIFEFMVLAVLLVSALHNIFKRMIPSLLLSGIISICIAFIDEMFQSLSIERTSSLFDVMIDSIGAMVGLIAIGVFVFFRWVQDPKKK
ncbi:MAG: hypothetical protein CVV02_12930 [Firmicutes bacterium HGW-Firmicutes-7]|nr:MAG: hypothetical protein CVV02_12930 [Firmicutes bacterium HGW-Firmicutes-7]